MIHTILLPLDGSDVSEAAIPLAIRLAREAPATLNLLMVHQPIPAMVGMGAVPVSTVDLDQETRSRELLYLTGKVSEIGPIGPAPAQVHHLFGSAGPGICEEAARLGADLVIMATHGRGAVGRFWLGSVADYVVRHMAAPVLLVHAEAQGGTPTGHPIRDVLVALDHSKASEAVLEPAVALATMEHAGLTLLHVLEPFHEVAGPRAPFVIPQDPAVMGAARVEAQRRLDALAAPLRERGLTVSTLVVEGIESVAGMLLETLEDPKYDAVAMTTHGAGGMRRILLGSVADKVIRGATKPVLVLRPAR